MKLSCTLIISYPYPKSQKQLGKVIFIRSFLGIAAGSRKRTKLNKSLDGPEKINWSNAETEGALQSQTLYVWLNVIFPFPGFSG